MNQSKEPKLKNHQTEKEKRRENLIHKIAKKAIVENHLKIN